MTQEEEAEFGQLKSARDSLLLTIANLRWGDRVTSIPKYFIVRPADLDALGLTMDEVTKMIKEKSE